MKAIMLAAGEGTRCYPFTHLSPKIAQEVCGIPILEYMLSWFSGAPGISRLYILVRNNSTVDTVKKYIQNRESYSNEIIDSFMHLGYKVENTNPDLEIDIIGANGWGTGGDLRHALMQIKEKGLDKDILVCNADYVTVRKLSDGKLSPQLNLTDIIDYHKKCKKVLDTVMTIALTPVDRESATKFGVAHLKVIDDLHVIEGFIEKPGIETVPEKPRINAGVYVLDSDFLLSNIDELLPYKSGTNLEKTIIERLAGEKQTRMAAYLLDLYAWFDIGTLEQLISASLYIAYKKGNQ